MTRYAEVAVELPVFGRYHYTIPEVLAGAIAPGVRVLVPFGARRVAAGRARLRDPGAL